MNECNNALPNRLRMRLNLPEETVEAVTLVPHERVQQRTAQRTAEQIEDAPQSSEETVEAVTLVPHERVQQRTAERIEDAPQSSGRDRRGGDVSPA